MNEITRNLLRASVASCDCGTKTPEVNYHHLSCKYRAIMEAVDYINTLEEELERLTEDYDYR